MYIYIPIYFYLLKPFHNLWIITLISKILLRSDNLVKIINNSLDND